MTDASGGVSDDAHDMAVQRMVQAGARPITWLQYMLELQRDWARQGTYEAVTGIAKEHGGGHGLGIIYAKKMFGRPRGRPLGTGAIGSERSSSATGCSQIGADAAVSSNESRRNTP